MRSGGGHPQGGKRGPEHQAALCQAIANLTHLVLADLVDGIKTTGGELAGASTPPGVRDGMYRSSNVAAALSLGEESQAAAAQVLELLGPGHGFLDLWELPQFLMHEVALATEAKLDLADAILAAAAALAEPPPSHPFSIPAIRESPFGINTPLGGANDLRLVSYELSDTVWRIELEGRVLARSNGGALRSAERLVQTFIGALSAVDIAGHIRVSAIESMAVKAKIDGEDEPVHSHVADLIARSFLRLPTELSDLERTRLERGTLNATGRMARLSTEAIEAVCDRPVRLLTRAMAADGEAGDQIRNACRLAAIAVGSDDHGLTLMLAFGVIEGLLLDPNAKSDLLARLTEAVAHSIGTSQAHRQELRKMVKRLYEHRSAFVHTGKASLSVQVVDGVLDLMFQVLRREISTLPESKNAV